MTTMTQNAESIGLQWMLIPMFSALTGYTEKAVRRKVEDGVWINGKHYRKAPDGRITMNLQEYYKWVEQQN
ncbi:excisionase [Pseudoduganella sp. RAF53_2]|uniref:excisionase n=1 Tax=unclassified Pseudoduganella TaxID=2637179 RepID=UPI003F993992